MMNKKYFLGLDLSLSDTGVSVLSEDNEVKTFHIATELKDYKHSIARADYISNQVVDIIKKYKPDLIAIEDYFTSVINARATILLSELGTLVRFKLLKEDYGFWLVAPTQLKKFCTGKGNVNKDIVLKEVYKKWGFDTNNNNIADAVVLSYIAKALYNRTNGIKDKLFVYERDVITQIIRKKKLITGLKDI